MKVTASTVLMVPPEHFGFNSQTAQSNLYQKNDIQKDVADKAQQEFNNMMAKLMSLGINVILLEQKKKLPDAVFPNNWFSTHLNEQDKTDLFIYPMLTENRREEVCIQALKLALAKAQVPIGNVYDLRNDPKGILEGTGSVVFDRDHHKLYACLSPRTEKHMVQALAARLNYEAIIFDGQDNHRQAVYHTNIMLSIAKEFAVICLDCIPSKSQKLSVIEHLESSQKVIITISLSQVANMCGNVLELINDKGERFLVMSERAYQHFSLDQISLFEQYTTILRADISTIETIGGGSARCMMAEIFHR